MRDLPADHDPSDRLAALEQAIQMDAPAMGLFYREDRPTLGDGMNDIAARAGSKMPAKGKNARS